MILKQFHQAEFPPKPEEPSKPESSSSSKKSESSSKEKPDQTPPPPPVIVVEKIPTRLFEPSTCLDSINVQSATKERMESSYQYISTLLKDFGTSPDKTCGYPLSRSVLGSRVDLIRLLLDYGARPTFWDNYVIFLAIGMGDLCILRMLLEEDYVHPNENLPSDHSTSQKKFKGKLRVSVNDGMLREALKHKDYKIADYLMGKGLFVSLF